MKKQFLFGLLCVIGLNFTNAQDNCSTFYPMTAGAKFSYNLYDKKDKPSGTTEYKVIKVENSGGNTVATMNVKAGGTKPKDQMELEYEVTCTGDGISIDFNSLLSPQLKGQLEQMNAEMDISGTNVEIPNNLSVDQELADGELIVAMSMSGIKMNTEVKTTDRKVIGKESVTTPAGTFDCYVLASTISSKAMMAKMTFTDKVWLAKDIGIVKQETFNKKGKLSSRMELASFSK
ncbi:DUF3108 domain-containing protein [Flagellimonas sp. CMM7]|uniref:DUF3108 domain-containing protein n=1 Tax=Flagellimonas sp. CMM7 TaxID=2654676 RepID=UPI0013D6A76B|nr:DUF3108 domain-containing protein [Flagellimonas sp. CMM7]UII78413.1 DUF3108 domain-containing protein [Flagellimonas sp. CMM7]